MKDIFTLCSLDKTAMKTMSRAMKKDILTFRQFNAFQQRDKSESRRTVLKGGYLLILVNLLVLGTSVYHRMYLVHGKANKYRELIENRRFKGLLSYHCHAFAENNGERNFEIICRLTNKV